LFCTEKIVDFVEKRCVVQWRVPASGCKKSKPTKWDLYDAILVKTAG